MNSGLHSNMAIKQHAFSEEVSIPLNSGLHSNCRTSARQSRICSLDPFEFRAAFEPLSPSDWKVFQLVSIPLNSGLHSNTKESIEDWFNANVSIPLNSGLHSNTHSLSEEERTKVSIPLNSGLHSNLAVDRNPLRRAVSIPLNSGLHSNLAPDSTEGKALSLDPFEFRAAFEPLLQAEERFSGLSRSL